MKGFILSEKTSEVIETGFDASGVSSQLSCMVPAAVGLTAVFLFFSAGIFFLLQFGIMNW